MSVPSLVGGIVLKAPDLPGAIVFAAAYGLLIPGLIHRVVAAKSRSIMIIQVLIFTLERPTLFSLRASVAARPDTEWNGLTKYMQATFALGYLALGQTVLRIIRTMLVNATLGTPAADSENKSSAPRDDQPQRRYWIRRWMEFLMVLQLLALVIGIVATANMYPASETGQNRSHQVLRYISAALGLLFILFLTFSLLWAWRALPRVSAQAVRFVLILTNLLTIPPIYRLVVMHHTTPDIHAPGHQALNTTGDKAAFYVVHLLPELIVVALLCVVNVKDVCQTDFMGDVRYWDETPEEKEKRERKERDKALKAAKKKGLEEQA
ncbi:hypothetical protein R3P38DRAFT_2825564 [Favolaschia claudopus]|uniref:Proteophosphoglycan ppg4 n=1 Tax=Favolaschia claudopus TaxID=2862362 RepID=A0AAW0EKF6_9AGAR